MNEIWKDISGYEGLYKANSLGFIKSEKRTVPRKGKGGKISYPEKILQPSLNEKGYLKVSLSKNGREKKYKLHRIIALTFLENPFNLEEINHKDGDKTNNKIDNLEWISHLDNMRHAFKNGLILRYCNNKASKEVIQKTIEGEIVKIWPSAHEAWRNGFCFTRIAKCCRERKGLHKGFLWEWSQPIKSKKDDALINNKL